MRNRFVARLIENIEDRFTRAGATCIVERTWGRIYVDTPNEAVARDMVERTFGLVSGSPTTVVDGTMEAILDEVRAITPGVVQPGDSFAIRARRTGQHDFRSIDVGRRAGAVVLEEVPEATVDLTDPDKEIHVEVRDNKAYVFTEIVDGPGGLPMGSQGKVVVPFEGPRSPAAAWLCMRRGATVHAVVPPGCQSVVETLEPWAPGMAYTMLEEPVDRDGLLAAAEHLAARLGAQAVALDEHERFSLQDNPIQRPILRPLAGLPGKRWPAGAYSVAKQAAERHPQVCVAPAGQGHALGAAQVRSAPTQRL